MAQVKVILLSCGSFNPPTNMHLRMFDASTNAFCRRRAYSTMELSIYDAVQKQDQYYITCLSLDEKVAMGQMEVARDSLNRLGQYLVIGGIISPVHDAYGKKELAPSTYRCEMLELALKSSDWIKVSRWESSQESWTRTREVLQHHQNVLNSILSDERDNAKNMNHINANLDGYNSDSWLTNDIRNSEGPVRVKLLCGADFIQSFSTPGLWKEGDIEAILHNHGLVIISRQGYDPRNIIYESDLLTRYQNNIVIINEWITNEISSTKIRRALRRQESVKYLIPDSVIDFVRKHGLYGCSKTETKYKAYINESLSVPCLGDYILTPSPSDINMKSVHSSGENIYLELNTIENGDLKESEEKKEIFQSRIEIKLSDTKKSDSCVDFSRIFNSPAKSKKVGFTGEELVELQRRSEDPMRQSRKKPKSCANTSESRKMTTKMSSNGKSNLILRRSNSDAIMSQRNDTEGDVSVKIQFTKDGIKVISDKESIV